MNLDVRLSSLAAVARYTRRCEGPYAEQLRKMCESGGWKADRRLTSDLNHYLSQVGIAAEIALPAQASRPAPSQQTKLVYAEARQYTTFNPGPLIRRAYAHVWATLGRLRTLRHYTEAFLVVFRRAGRSVELPPVIDFAGFRLYSALVDISRTPVSHDPAATIRFFEANLRPTW